MNEIKDLLDKPAKQIKENGNDISNFYAVNLQTAYKILANGLKIAKVFSLL